MRGREKKRGRIGRKLAQLGQYLFVMRELVSRELKRKYARSYLGVIWSVLNPLMTMAVLSLIFSTMFKHSIKNFPIYFLTGNLFWQMFSTSTNASMTALVDNKNPLLKVKMPKQIFILARVYTALTNFGYNCVAYLLMLVLFRVKLTWTALLYPVAVLFCLLFSMGIGYFLSIAYVFFADVKYLYSILLTLWMYLSAIFYPVESTGMIMRKVIGMNPIYVYIAFAREVVMQGTIPEKSMWYKMILWAIFSFLGGYRFFKNRENEVMQKI